MINPNIKRWLRRARRVDRWDAAASYLQQFTEHLHAHAEADEWFGTWSLKQMKRRFHKRAPSSTATKDDGRSDRNIHLKLSDRDQRNEREMSLLKVMMEPNTAANLIDILNGAAKDGYDSVIEALMDRDVNINDPLNNITDHPLVVAVSNGHAPVVQLLLDQSFRHYPNSYRQFQKSGLPMLLWSAVTEGHDITTRILLEYSPELLKIAYASISLILAAREGHMEMIAQLLENGAMLDFTEVQKMLDLVSLSETQKFLRKIYSSKGEDIKTVINTRTALQAAAEKGHLKAVDHLLEKGAEINARPTDGGRTALQAAAGGGYLDIVDRLLEKGAKANASGAKIKGRTALQAAAEGGHLVVVERLRAAGASP